MVISAGTSVTNNFGVYNRRLRWFKVGDAFFCLDTALTKTVILQRNDLSGAACGALMSAQQALPWKDRQIFFVAFCRNGFMPSPEDISVFEVLYSVDAQNWQHIVRIDASVKLFARTG